MAKLSNFRIIALALCAIIVLTPTMILNWFTGHFYQLAGITHLMASSSAFSRSTIDNRLHAAEQLWRRSVEQRRQMAQRMENHSDRFRYPENAFDFVRATFSCPHHLKRVGALGDGGKWVCGLDRYEDTYAQRSQHDKSNVPMIIYSFGVGDDVSFEREMLERTNAEVWAYDHTVTGWPTHQISQALSHRAHFMPVQVEPTSDLSELPMTLSIQDIMAENGHEYVDIVKIDIEGAEFDVLSSLAAFVVNKSRADGATATLPIGQILMEVHILSRSPAGIPTTLEAWLDWWVALEIFGKRAVSNEGNWLGLLHCGYPNFMEASFSSLLS